MYVEQTLRVCGGYIGVWDAGHQYNYKCFKYDPLNNQWIEENYDGSTNAATGYTSHGEICRCP